MLKKNEINGKCIVSHLNGGNFPKLKADSAIRKKEEITIRN